MLVNNMFGYSGNPRPAFWMQQCPQRGPALNHTHHYSCEVHDRAQCCFCDATAETAAATFAPMPPVDIERRLNGTEPVVVTKEPAMALGHPVGSYEGPGRGDLTDFQKQYLSLVRDTQRDMIA